MNIQVFTERIYRSFLKRVGVKKRQKSYQDWLAKGYVNAPEISFVIQSHNASVEVKYIVSKLRKCPNSEIIVVDDGSDIKHSTALAAYLTRGCEFLLRANDLYEIVTYDRAIRLANSKYVVLLQDDNNFDDLAWVEKGVAYMAQHPDMVILGGRNGMTFFTLEEKGADGSPKYERVTNDDSSVDFKFVQHVNRAPMWINRELFLDKLLHIDFSFAPFQFDDVELCVRAWRKGLKVGWYSAGFYSLSAGGMRIWNNSLAREQCEKNLARFYELHGDSLDEINRKIDRANNELSSK